jgi:hypothetical protein
VSLVSRLVALERRRRFGGHTEAEVRTRAEQIARHFDLPAVEVYDRMVHYLRVGPDAAMREAASELGMSVEDVRREAEAIREAFP